MISRMNPQQLAPFDFLFSAITAASPAHTVVYLDGQASCGKLFVASTLSTKLQCENCIPIIAGTTARSLTFYEKGGTAYSGSWTPVSAVCPYFKREFVSNTMYSSTSTSAFTSSSIHNVLYFSLLRMLLSGKKCKWHTYRLWNVWMTVYRLFLGKTNHLKV